MRQLKPMSAILLFALAGVAAGQESNDESAFAAKLNLPRPAELDALEPLIGTWESTFEITEHMPEGPGRGVERREAKWVLDKQFVQMQGQMKSTIASFDTMYLLTYDDEEKAHKAYSFNTFRSVDNATIVMDAPNKRWYWRSEGIDYETKKPGMHETVLNFVGDDTIEWEWSVTPEGSDTKKVLMKGVDKRKK